MLGHLQENPLNQGFTIFFECVPWMAASSPTRPLHLIGSSNTSCQVEGSQWGGIAKSILFMYPDSDKTAFPRGSDYTCDHDL